MSEAEPEGPDRDAQLRVMKDEIDALQITVAERSRPWYRQAPLLISLVALLLSFATTLYSERRSQQEEVHNAKIELRELIAQIGEVTTSNAQLARTYQDNPEGPTLASSLGRTQHLVLAGQAGDIIDEISSEVTGSEYFAVASALGAYNVTERVLDYHRRGVEVSQGIDDYTANLRGLGYAYFATGDVERGRENYRAALSVDRFRTLGEDYRRSFNVATYVFWANNELFAKHCPEAAARYSDGVAVREQLRAGGYDVAFTQPLLGPLHQALTARCPAQARGLPV